MEETAPLTPPSNFHLVLCAAHRVLEDSWFFGDFIGLCNLLKESGVGGDFVSCYSLNEYFANPTTPDSIKFGTFRGSTKAIAAYTKRQHEMRSRFFTQIKTADTYSYLLSWFKRTSSRAHPGDAVSVLLLSHGNSNGVALGGKMLDPDTLIEATKEFKEGVQVNIAFQPATQACLLKHTRDVHKLFAISSAPPKNIPGHTIRQELYDDEIAALFKL